MSTIAADHIAQTTAPAALWTPAHVRDRMVEAYRIERRLPTARKPATGSWPTTIYEFADKVYWGADARERVLAAWANAGGVFATDVERMEAAHEWARVYLAPHPVERTCLLHWAAAMAYGKSLRAILRRRGWSRTSFYRHVGAGSFVIAGRLNAEGVAVN